MTTGIFLGYTVTDRTIWFEDTTTGRLKSARHAIFDKAHYIPNNRPPPPTLKNWRISPKKIWLIHLLQHLYPAPDPSYTGSRHTTFPTYQKKSPIIEIAPPPTPLHQLHHISTSDDITTHSTAHVLTTPCSTLSPDKDTTQLPTVLATSSSKPEEFTLWSNPFGHSVNISLPTKETYPKLGLSISNTMSTTTISSSSHASHPPQPPVYSVGDPRWDRVSSLLLTTSRLLPSHMCL